MDRPRITPQEFAEFAARLNDVMERSYGALIVIAAQTKDSGVSELADDLRAGCDFFARYAGQTISDYQKGESNERGSEHQVVC